MGNKIVLFPCQTGGSLQNNEKLGQILHKMLTCVPALTNNLPGPPQFNKITREFYRDVTLLNDVTLQGNIARAEAVWVLCLIS